MGSVRCTQNLALLADRLHIYVADKSRQCRLKYPTCINNPVYYSCKTGITVRGDFNVYVGFQTHQYYFPHICRTKSNLQSVTQNIIILKRELYHYL